MASVWMLLKELFSLRAAVDIGLVSAGLYFLYRTLLRLGTWKIVTGILLALVLVFLANLLDLRGIEWISSNLSPVAVIALIVIFQPELRKLFERAASMRGGKSRAADDALTEILVDTLVRLAEQRCGALFVLPGKEPLQEWLAGGMPLDAAPSTALMLSIFDHHSPGHDGALIIDQGRLAQFGARLPISQTDRLPAELGTRHHAAMGLAEKSDALILAVSEERGTISAFSYGRYEVLSGRDRIAAAIATHWKAAAASAMAFTKGGSRWPLAIQLMASVLLAVVFWSGLTVTQREVTEKILTLPVEYTGTAPNLALVGDVVTEARVHLSGYKAAIGEVSPSMLTVTIDLSKAGAGKQALLISADNLELPEGVRVMEIMPSSLEVTLAALAEKRLTVKPQLVGVLPGQKRLASVSVRPETIQALVPGTMEEDAVTSVTTTPIYLESITSDTVIFCKVIAPPSIQPSDKRWPDVEVRLTLAPKE